MPLAIELAAARVTAMSPAEIGPASTNGSGCSRAERRRRVKRHQTLRAAVEWSVLAARSRRRRSVFDRLGVFVGGFDAAAAVSVVTDAEARGWDVLECLGSLVEKSMVPAEDGDEGTQGVPAARDLPGLRARATRGGRGDHWRRRHAEYYAAFCERAGPELEAPTSPPGAAGRSSSCTISAPRCGGAVEATAQADADLASVLVTALNILESQATTWSTLPWADVLTPRARTSSVAGRSGVISAAAAWPMLQDDLEDAERLAREALESPTGPGVSRSSRRATRCSPRCAAARRPRRSARTRGRGSPRPDAARAPSPTTVRCTTACRSCASASAIPTAPEEKPMYT